MIVWKNDCLLIQTLCKNKAFHNDIIIFHLIVFVLTTFFMNTTKYYKIVIRLYFISSHYSLLKLNILCKKFEILLKDV